MLQSSTLSFLKNLKKNNTKEWFDKNRKTYEAAKQNFVAFVDEMIVQLAKTDATIARLQAKECIFRINRDIRFSKDKSPYKINMGAFLNEGGKKSSLAGYYFHLEPGNSFVGGGIYMPEADVVKKIRQEIDYSFTEFSSIIQHKNFKKEYGGLDVSEENSLAREPKGYDKNNPAIEYLKLKNWIAFKTLADDELTDKDVMKKIISAFNALHPLVVFLNRALKE
jgi:uncharacterized protein (TIGR02453 family)